MEIKMKDKSQFEMEIRKLKESLSIQHQRSNKRQNELQNDYTNLQNQFNLLKIENEKLRNNLGETTINYKDLAEEKEVPSLLLDEDDNHNDNNNGNHV